MKYIGYLVFCSILVSCQLCSAQQCSKLIELDCETIVGDLQGCPGHYCALSGQSIWLCEDGQEHDQVTDEKIWATTDAGPSEGGWTQFNSGSTKYCTKTWDCNCDNVDPNSFLNKCANTPDTDVDSSPFTDLTAPSPVPTCYGELGM
jgi:hypothetical protein